MNINNNNRGGSFCLVAGLISKGKKLFAFS